MKTFLIASVIIISSCNNSSQNKSGTDSVAANNNSIPTQKDTTNNEVINDSVIHIKFPADSISTTVRGRMKGINHPVAVYIPIKQGRQLTASILPEDSVANIRFNQIFMPDGKADGPFGRDLKRDIHQQGMYKLIISENMMQGDEWKGNFKLKVKVE